MILVVRRAYPQEEAGTQAASAACLKEHLGITLVLPPVTSKSYRGLFTSAGMSRFTTWGKERGLELVAFEFAVNQAP